MKLQKQTQLQHIIQFIKEIPIVKDCRYKDDELFDAHIIVDMQSGEVMNIGLIMLSNGYPSIVKNTYEKYHSLLNDKYLFIYASYISDITYHYCKDNSISFMDGAGNCLLNFGSVYIDIKGNKNNHVSKRGLKSIYERSSVVSSKILRVLFEDINRPWKMKELSEYVGCSIGQVSKVKNFLAQNDQMKQTDEGMILTKPKEVLEEWAKVYGKNTDIIECYSMDNIVDIETKLINMKDKIGVDYYLTGYSGGVRYQPVVRYYKVHVYVSSLDLEKVISYLNCEKTSFGSNITLIVPYDESVLMNWQYIDNSQVVSPVQMYLDGININGRCEVLAEAILEKEILNGFST
ncbi:MAG: hypothetical protein LUG60_05370 [Erysipelotrichaceae bacterium]|nr:hypothetical protein [Erysipelotrichaceae bacterium]